METLEAIKKRCSIREFSEKPVEESKLESLIDAARLAHTARGIEPWEFIVIRDKETLAKIAKIAENGKFIKGSSACIAVLSKETKYFLEDGCAATENILIGACALELASCWVAGDKKSYAKEVSEILEAPDSYKLVSLIALGYSSVKASGKGKRELDEVIHWEKFQAR